MKQIVVVSGKGGTGKTTVLASFAALAGTAALADCDVDAANLHLVLHPREQHREDFRGAKAPVRDEALCTRCGECERRCRFGAIRSGSPRARGCEGCGLCVLACPAQALRLEPVVNGTLFTGDTRYGPMVHARLEPGAENSGRLVTRVRQEVQDLASRHGLSLILLDGAPGIGCTVIASLVDADQAVVVTEPSPAGRHDMERVVELTTGFGIPVAVMINKADLNLQHTLGIRDFCLTHDLPVLAELPYDEAAVRANARQMPLVESDDGPAAEALRQAWRDLQALVGAD